MQHPSPAVHFGSAAAMPKLNQFQVGYAKSNMATCRVCMAKIPKGALRIGHTQVEGPMLENDATAAAAAEADASPDDQRSSIIAGATRWHHFECFPRMKGAKWMSANLPSCCTALDGFAAIPKVDQRKVESLWKAMTQSFPSSASAGSKRKAGSTEDKSVIKAKTDAAAKMARLTSPQGVLTTKDWKQIAVLEGELSPATTAQLQQELELNKQVKSGKRAELVQRVAEGRVLGALPGCPRCPKGRIHWSRIGGWHSCPGYYDKELDVLRRCYFRSQTMKRGKWKRAAKGKAKDSTKGGARRDAKSSTKSSKNDAKAGAKNSTKSAKVVVKAVAKSSTKSMKKNRA